MINNERNVTGIMDAGSSFDQFSLMFTAGHYLNELKEVNASKFRDQVTAHLFLIKASLFTVLQSMSDSILFSLLGWDVWCSLPGWPPFVSS